MAAGDDQGVITVDGNLVGQHEGQVNSLNWSDPSIGEFLASAGQDGAVKVWQQSQGKWSLVLNHSGDTPARTVSFAPGQYGMIVGAGFADGSFLVIEY